MERFTNIVTEKNKTTAIFLSNDTAEVNMLKRAIQSEIETVAIDIVIVYTNTSARHDEILSFRLGQLVIDNERLEVRDFDTYRVRVDVSGPLDVTTEHIPEIPFKYKTPIIKLRAGEKIVCDIILVIGTARTHIKWRPISTFVFEEHELGFLIKMGDNGMLSPEQILLRGYEKIRTAADRKSANIFARQLRPENL
jgi:DNA-directed RNA polymerase alpha subunit